MRLDAAASIMLIATATLGTGDAYTQARGPSHRETREKGQTIVGAREAGELARREALRLDEQERIELADPAVRSRVMGELEAFLRRLSGRFRINGTIRTTTLVAVTTGFPGIPVQSLQDTRSGEVTGIVDCSAVGEGPGVVCVFSASWPTIDATARMPVPLGGRLDVLVNYAMTASEQLNTMRPAVLVLGLTQDPPRLRSMLVTADTLAYSWAGKLDGHNANLTGPSPSCYFVVRCYRALEITARPESDAVSFTLKGGGATTITLALHRDPEATPETQIKSIPMR